MRCSASSTLFAALCALVLTADARCAEQLLMPEGYWSGWAERDGVRSEVAVRVSRRDAELTGTVDWPGMGYLRTDLLGAVAEGDSVRFSVPLPVGAIKLLGKRNEDLISGTLDPIGLVNGEWKSLGVGGAFELRRGSEPPLPYRIEDTTFESGDVTLAASIFVPAGEAKRVGVVFIAGSGDTTRGDGSFLADYLARAGIVTLVYDKRGAGRSTGDWKRGGFDELALDATAALEALRRRSDVQASRVGFVCQSQGCWVAPIALRRGAPARFLVAQSGPGVSVSLEDLDFYRVTLRKQGFSDADIEDAFDLVRTSQQVSLGAAQWAELEARVARFAERPWFKALGYEPEPIDAPGRVFEGKTVSYDPAADLDALQVPSLWVYGGADTIIPVEASIAAVRASAARPRPQIVVLPGAGHTFALDDHVIPRIVPDYPGLLVRWLQQLD